VVRLGAMGDILHALPAVTALRLAHPRWVIDWVVEPRWQPLLAGPAYAADSEPPSADNRLIDRLYLAPAKKWGESPLSRETIHELKVLRRDLRAGAYDAVIDFQGAIRSAAIGRISGAPRLIGESSPREWGARWLFNERIATSGAHVIEQDVELAAAVVGDNLSPVHPWLPVDPAAETWANGILPPTADQKAVLINPGAGWGAKCWPTDRYAAVTQGLIDRGLRVLVNAGPGEQPLAEAIFQAIGSAATPLTCSLQQLIALTRRVALVVAGDTGPLHLACALVRPVLGIYGPTDPSRNGPFGTRFKVLRSPNSRRDHTRYAEPEAGLLTIEPQDVLHAADQLLAPEAAP